MKDAGRSSLAGGFAVTLHETRVAGESYRFAGIALGKMDLEEAEGRAAVFEIEREGFSFFMISQAREGIVENNHIVGHIRRDPQKRISMDSLQKQNAICNRL